MPMRRQLTAAAAFAALVPLGVSGKAGTCAPGSACATRDAAADGSSLLQAGPKSAGPAAAAPGAGEDRTAVGSWQPPRKPQDKDKKEHLPAEGLKEDYKDTHVCGEATDFETYPPYYPDDGPSAGSKKASPDRSPVNGRVVVSAFTGLTPASSGIYVNFNFLGADPYCDMGPAPLDTSGKRAARHMDAKDGGRKGYYDWDRSCGVEIRAATSCSSINDLGDPLFNPALRKMNPWDCIKYTAVDIESARTAEQEQDSDDPALLEDPALYGAKDSVIVYTGMGPNSVRGKFVIVYDYYGMALACAPIVDHVRGSMPAAEIQRPPPSLVAGPGHASLRALTARNFVKYVGSNTEFDVWGEVYVHERMGGTPSTYAQVLSWDLEGVDPLCSGGASPSTDSNSCGIHVHDGTSCTKAAKGHYWDNELRHRDPWTCVAYTAAVAPTKRVVKAIGQGVPAHSGYTSTDIVKKLVIVHDFLGRRIACAVLGF